jgi:RsiW-degrading membrane proteinase PrsW (M82 family)
MSWLNRNSVMTWTSGVVVGVVWFIILIYRYIFLQYQEQFSDKCFHKLAEIIHRFPYIF